VRLADPNSPPPFSFHLRRACLQLSNHSYGRGSRYDGASHKVRPTKRTVQCHNPGDEDRSIERPVQVRWHAGVDDDDARRAGARSAGGLLDEPTVWLKHLHVTACLELWVLRFRYSISHNFILHWAACSDTSTP
jgi:hypothetical protein